MVLRLILELVVVVVAALDLPTEWRVKFTGCELEFANASIVKSVWFKQLRYVRLFSCFFKGVTSSSHDVGRCVEDSEPLLHLAF